MLFESMKDLVAKWEPHRESLLMAIDETHGTHTEDDVLAMILSGRLMLHASEDSAWVLEVNEYPRMKVLNIFLAGGSLSDLRAHEQWLLAEAKRLGCSRVTFGGRKSWRAAMIDRPSGLSGYKEGGSFIYKDVA